MAATLISTKKEESLLNRMNGINSKIRELSDEAEKLKKQLIATSLYDFEANGTFVTKAGAVLTVTERVGKQIPPSIEDTIALLKKYRKGHRLNAVCKVDVALLKKELSDEALKGFIKRSKPSFAWSFGKAEE